MMRRKWCEVAQSGEQDATRATPRTQHRPGIAPEVGIPVRCSPASTGTRWTTRDGSPSRRGSAPSSTRGSSSRAGSTHCLAIHTRAGWDALADKVATLPDHRRARAPLPAVHLRRRRRDDARRPGPRPHPGLSPRDGRPRTPRPSSSAPATTPRSGLPPRWETYRRSLEDPDDARRGHRRPRDLGTVRRSEPRTYHMRFQGPLGIRSSTVEER